MKHKTWGQLVQSRDAIGTDIQTAAEDRGTDEENGAEDDVTPAQKRAIRRNNIVQTRFLVAASVVCGAVVSQRGPSILDLGDAIRASLQSTASLFALGAVGQAAGCVGAGMLLGRLGSGIFLFWGMLALAATTAALPWCAGYGAMAAVYCLSLMCVGAVETGSYAEIAQRWGNEGDSKIQLLQLWFVVGGVISPGMTQFFLAPRNLHHHHHLTPLNNVTSGPNDITQSASNWNVTTAFTNNLTEYTPGFNRSHEHSNGTDVLKSRVEIAYLISGALALVASAPFLVTFFLRKNQSLALARGSRKGDTLTTPKPPLLQVRDFNITVLFLAALFVFLINAVENSLHQFLFSFLVHEVFWISSAAAWVTTWFFSGMLLVRTVAYFLPDQMTDEMILALSCTALPCTLAGLHASVVSSHDNDGVWACVFFAGMSISLISPIAFKWMLTNLAQKLSMISVVTMASSLLAGIVNPLLLGFFLQNGRGLAFTLLLTAEAVLALLIFLLLHVLSRRLTASWHGMTTRKSIHVAAPGRLEEEKVVMQNSEEAHDSDL